MLKSATKSHRLSRVGKKEQRTAYLCLIPAFIGLIFLTYVPLIEVFVISFFNWRGPTTPTFNGINNYIKLFTTDPYFTTSIVVTVVYSLLSVIGGLIYSLIIALLLNRKVPARGFFRALFYLPYVLPAAAVYIGWSWLYEPNFGLFNYILKLCGVQENVLFLNDSKTVLPSLALIAVWLSGNLIVIFLAGLQNVPRVYHEAAEIDGANAWQRFRHVTIPSMTPIIFYNLLMSLITNMQVVTPSMALTQGGPSKSTMFITYLMYRYAFKSNQIGYACAISFVFFIIIAIFTAIVFTTSKSWVYYEGGEN